MRLAEAIQPRFVGFERDFQTHLEQCSVFSTRPEIEVIEDAVYLPFRRRGKKARKDGSTVRFVGGLYRPDGSRIPTADLTRGYGSISVGDDRIDISSIGIEKEIADTVLLQSFHFRHYGHFLVESLSRLWAVHEGYGNLPMLFLAPADRRRFLPYQEALLEASGIDRKRLLFARGPTRLRRVVVPAPAFEIRSRVHDCYKEPFERLAAAAAMADDRPIEKLYLSRSRWPRGRVVGEQALEEELERQGFHVFHPEQHDLLTQIRTYARARTIVGCIGSAMHNLLFAFAAEQAVYLVGGQRINSNYFLVDAVKNLSSTYIHAGVCSNCEPARDEPWLLDLARVFQSLEELGVAGRPSSVIPNVAALRAEHDR